MCKMLLLYLFGECRETDNWQPRNAVLTLAKRYTHQMQVARPVFIQIIAFGKNFLHEKFASLGRVGYICSRKP